ncbi:MAG: class I SAM-dependent methyltransferase [Oscillospiraceae bacterium]|jgi:tRNA (adenine22-N1)-methyltransferase|nr:class I SAM-dependent methyltransferase [Oscillospiraceae bacterium]
MTLSFRLKMCADLLPAHIRTIADIGSDHAYLPCTLLRRNRIDSAIATDVREGPLLNAANTLKGKPYAGRCELRLSDGFAAFAPGEAEGYFLCGMGGTGIADILLRGKIVLQIPGTVVVIQPNSHAHEVRAMLTYLGYVIEAEQAVTDNVRTYGAILAAYDPIHAPRQHDLADGWFYYGKLPECNSAAAQLILQQTLAAVRTRADKLYAADFKTMERLYLESFLPDLESVVDTHAERWGHL